MVALGEEHGSAAQHAVITELVRHPRLPDVVDAVVVEFGTARRQAVLDAYVRGEAVSDADLAAVWRESTQRSGVWDRSVYRAFFDTVRAVNAGLEDDAVRVLAGDPPVEWSTITDTVDRPGSVTVFVLADLWRGVVAGRAVGGVQP